MGADQKAIGCFVGIWLVVALTILLLLWTVVESIAVVLLTASIYLFALVHIIWIVTYVRVQFGEEEDGEVN